MKRKRGSLLIIIGTLLIACALCLTLYNYYRENRAYAGADEAESEMAGLIPDRVNPVVTFDVGTIEDTSGSAVTIDESTVLINGIKYLGIIELPTANIKLPVCADFSYENMAVSPCRWQGTVAENDIVICGHNYRRHFGRLDNLGIGDTATFTDADGYKYNYKVVGYEIINGTDVEGMLSGDWDMTLFTCTMDGRSRITIRLDRTN
ncbi:MAG: sortase [Catonella sp.]|nr:sortase [Catonella sp.]